MFNILVSAVCLWMCFMRLNADSDVVQQLHVSLNGAWTAQNENGSVGNVSSTVPGSIYTDLLSNGLISDPYYRFNDRILSWVGRDNWKYKRLFQVDEALLSKREIFLVCEGVDTFSSIEINGRHVGQTTNMFVRYTFPVKPYLVTGLNVITVNIRSAVRVADDLSRHAQYDVPPDCPNVPFGDCHVNFIRKEQCAFGWDWGPSFPTVGIWKNIGISASNDYILLAASAAVIYNKLAASDQWSVQLTLNYEVGTPRIAARQTYRVIIPQLKVNQTGSFKVTKTVTFKVKIPNQQDIELWWPNGYGKQAMYDVTFTTPSTRKTFRIGFKTVELVEKPILNSKGLSFYFKINGHPIFMKGSNWIPADSFQSRVTSSTLHNRLKSAVDANINMLRVWGGGVYESDDFYSLVSELGILIWQDMMYACAMYPTDRRFLESVTIEIEQQVTRLAQFPAVAIWSANNENEVAIAQNWYNTSRNYSIYVTDYVTLYIKTVLPSIARNDPSQLPIVASSPSNGRQESSTGWIAKNPTDERYGDVHYYVYEGQLWDWSAYPKPRFISEYGFQSLPSLETLSSVSLPEDWSYDSEFIRWRQHHKNGNEQNLDVLSKNLDVPNTSNKTQDFIQLIYLLQINQAMIIKTATEHYRRLQGNLVDGLGMTMGALYWQLQDIWPAPSWASIESTGRWKMLHYYVRKFFSRRLISAYINNATLEVFYVHDVLPPNTDNQARETVQRMKCVITVWSLSYGYKSLTKHTSFFNEPSVASKRLLQVPVRSIISRSGLCRTQKNCFLHLELFEQTDGQTTDGQTTDGQTTDGQTTDRQTTDRQTTVWRKVDSNVLFLGDLRNKDKLIARSRLKIKTVSWDEPNSRYKISLQQAPPMSLFVWLQTTVPGRFTDNGFHMLTYETEVGFLSWRKTSVAEISRTLSVKWLNT